MKRYPIGTAADKAPSLFKAGFKLAAGAYLGWNIMVGLDRGIGEVVNPRLYAWKDRMLEKLEAKS